MSWMDSRLSHRLATRLSWALVLVALANCGETSTGSDAAVDLFVPNDSDLGSDMGSAVVIDMTMTPPGVVLPGDIVDSTGTVVPDAYIAMADQLGDDTGIEYRYGPSYGFYHPTAESFPTYYKRPDQTVPGNGNYPMLGQVGGPAMTDAGDWFIGVANTTFVPDDRSVHFGVSNYQTVAETLNVFFAMPQWFAVFGGQGLDDLHISDYKSDGLDVSKPTATARCNGKPGWCLVGVTTFLNGLIAGPMGGNTSINTAHAQLAAGKVPSAVALTNSEEFALIPVWDKVNVKGQVAVVALAGLANGATPANPDIGDVGWGEWGAVWPGLANNGNLAFMKVVGYIDLPDMKAPTEIAVTTGWNPWNARVVDSMGNYSSPYKQPLTDETARQSYISGNNTGAYAKTGIAVVISKSEKKATFIDLRPLFNHYDGTYFGPKASFDAIVGKVGTGAGQWPPTFTEVSSQIPTIIKTVTFADKPTAVKTTQFPIGTHHQAWIATQDGQLHIFELGTALTTGAAAVAGDLTEVGTVAIGKNPTSVVPFRAESNDTGNAINVNAIALSRGDRRVDWIAFTGNTGTITRTLRDSRIIDPISIDDIENHGTSAYLLSIADYGAKAISSYMYGPVIFWTNQTPGWACQPPTGCTMQDEQGQPAQFEFGGSMMLPGKPFHLTSANVP